MWIIFCIFWLEDGCIEILINLLKAPQILREGVRNPYYLLVHFDVMFLTLLISMVYFVILHLKCSLLWLARVYFIPELSDKLGVYGELLQALDAPHLSSSSRLVIILIVAFHFYCVSSASKHVTLSTTGVKFRKAKSPGAVGWQISKIWWHQIPLCPNTTLPDAHPSISLLILIQVIFPALCPGQWW